MIVFLSLHIIFSFFISCVWFLWLLLFPRLVKWKQSDFNIRQREQPSPKHTEREREYLKHFYNKWVVYFCVPFYMLKLPSWMLKEGLCILCSQFANGHRQSPLSHTHTYTRTHTFYRRQTRIFVVRFTKPHNVVFSSSSSSFSPSSSFCVRLSPFASTQFSIHTYIFQTEC